MTDDLRWAAIGLVAFLVGGFIGARAVITPFEGLSQAAQVGSAGPAVTSGPKRTSGNRSSRCVGQDALRDALVVEAEVAQAGILVGPRCLVEDRPGTQALGESAQLPGRRSAASAGRGRSRRCAAPGRSAGRRGSADESSRPKTWMSGISSSGSCRGRHVSRAEWRRAPVRRSVLHPRPTTPGADRPGHRGTDDRRAAATRRSVGSRVQRRAIGRGAVAAGVAMLEA